MILLLGLTRTSFVRAQHTATPGQISTGVQGEHNYCGNVTPAGSTATKTILVGPVTVTIRYDPTDPELAQKDAALREAINDMLTYGFQLPLTLYVVFANDISQAVACHTFPNPTIVIGNRCNNVNPLSPNQPAVGVEGGVGTRGPRGVADQAHDEVFAKEKIPGLPASCSPGAKKAAKHARCEATLVHELCHVAHVGQNPQEFWWSRGNATATDGGWLPASTDVSVYANSARVEFVAEVCTGLVMGKIYPQAVMAAYTALGGPVPGVPYQPVPPPPL